MVNERAMVRALLEGGKFRPGFAFEDAELAQIPHPTLMVYGSADPTGNVEVWKRFVDFLPAGKLSVREGAGHMPWWDDPKAVGDEVATFLRTT
jgi:pimeloyl-ACP methyl ester carboxylesterase